MNGTTVAASSGQLNAQALQANEEPAGSNGSGLSMSLLYSLVTATHDAARREEVELRRLQQQLHESEEQTASLQQELDNRMRLAEQRHSDLQGIAEVERRAMQHAEEASTTCEVLLAEAMQRRSTILTATDPPLLGASASIGLNDQDDDEGRLRGLRTTSNAAWLLRSVADMWIHERLPRMRRLIEDVERASQRLAARRSCAAQREAAPLRCVHTKISSGLAPRHAPIGCVAPPRPVTAPTAVTSPEEWVAPAARTMFRKAPP